ncbi:MAG: cadmium-translocating P-type ATPase [Erysipelotrichaceae bacterium]|nr:cadmium-translocating P-type ATPase [Erysipelotrichaceae bacterium]
MKYYILEGLDCANCAAKIESKLMDIKGVKEANISFATKTLSLQLEKEEEAMIEKVYACIHEIEPHIQCIPKEAKTVRTSSNESKKWRLAGLDCAHCAEKIEAQVQSLPEVKEAAVNFSLQTLQVTYENKYQKSIFQTIQQAIYEIEPQIQVQEMEEKVAEKKTSFLQENSRLFIGTVLFIGALILKSQWFAVYLFILSFLCIGWNVLQTAYRNILKREMFDEHFLMSVATIGAFLIGEYAEGVAVMLFYEIGELCQTYAVRRSRSSISSLMDIRAEEANIVIDGKVQKVAVEQVQVDDEIVIKAGERIPLDGIIIEGSSALDTSALTGESLPRDVVQGDEVLAGTINLHGLLRVRVNKLVQETTLTRMLELVENASARKAPVERFITKFARIYTPIVVGLAILIAIVPPLLLEGSFSQEWLYRALTFLVVSCPCALVISIPLGLFAGIGGASRKGVLIKGGNYLEALQDVDTIVFDKTGTLTQGSFHVTCIQAADQAYALELAAHGEHSSNHPIAQSILEAYNKEIDESRITFYEELAGYGVHAKIDGEDVYLGNDKLMAKQGIAYENSEQIGTILHIAKQKEYLGYIVIADKIKDTSAKAIQELKAKGIRKVVMLTGDHQRVAQKVSEQLQLDEFYAQLLPQDKVTQVERLLEQEAPGKKLAFVGDGINDAPVLARADVGVAMGGIGSDAAIEAADVVLMEDDPRALVKAISISKKTKHILLQNIIFSIVVKVGVLIFAIFGFANMWVGVFADVGVTLLAIFNAMRTLRS